MELKKILKYNAKLYIAMATIILLGTIGVTLALTTTNFNPIAVNTTTSTIDAEVTYDEGTNSSEITTTGGEILPIPDSEIDKYGENIDNPRVLKAQFNVSGLNSNPDNTIYDVALYSNDTNNNQGIGCELRTEEVKWRLYKNGALISSGNLSPKFDVMDNGRLVLTNTQQDLTLTPDKYTFILWISESCTGDITECNPSQDQSKYLNKSINASLKIELATKSKKTLKRVTSDELSCNYTNIDVPTCNNLTYNSNVQMLINSSNYYTIENNTGSQAGSYKAILKLNEGYKWSDETTTEKTINCSISKKNVIITSTPQTISYGGNISTNLNNLSVEGLLSGHTLKSALITQSKGTIGTGIINVSNAVIIDSNNNDVTNNYIINYNNNGILTINCNNSSTLPTTTDYTYTGESIKGITGGNNIEIAGVSTAAEIGTYTVTVKPKTNYCWSDSSTTPKTLTWSILDNVQIIALDDQIAETEINGTSTLYYKDNRYYINPTYTKSMTTTENPILLPIKVGYTFDGYYTETNGNGTQMIDSNGYATEALLNTEPSTTTYSIRSSGITLYANWKQKTYTIIYNANGGTGSPPTQYKKYGEPLTLSDIEPTKPEAKFIGWSTEPNANTPTYVPGDTYTVNTSATLYAIYIGASPAVDYITNLFKNNNPTEKIHYQDDGETEQARYYYSYMDEDETWGLMNDALGATVTDTTALINATQGNIRYFGASPNNYIYFNCDDYSNQYYEDENTGKKNCERWRIIGVFDNKLKIISEESLGNYSWDYTSTGEYDNNWHDSTLMTLLNNGYYNNSNEISYYNNSTTPITINFKQDNKGIKNVKTQGMISESTWYLGGHNSSGIYTNDIYGYEIGAAKCSGCTYDTIWTGKIALMYPSDYGYAADLSKCNKNLYDYYATTNCKGTDWLFNSEDQWLLTPNSSYADLAWYVGLVGNVNYGNYVSNANGVSPVLYLNSELAIESGEGTIEKPYELG